MELLSMLWTSLLYLIGAGVCLLILLSIFLYVTTKPYPNVKRFKDEETFFDPVTKSRIKLPSINEPSTLNLSVIVPAYNEEERLLPMLDETLKFLENRIKEHSTYKYEIIIVSDGSKDETVQVAQTYAKKYGSEKLRCLELVENRGKGGAVQLVKIQYKGRGRLKKAWMDCVKEEMLEKGVNMMTEVDATHLPQSSYKSTYYTDGIQNARGATILFADADGASKFEDLVKLESALKDIIKCDPITDPEHVSVKVGLAIGSRAHLEKESLATRSLFRNILMYGFHFLVWLFTVKGIKDTQCGFKLFTRKAADICFQSLHVNRWAFDVELLYIAQKLNIPIAEIPIRWTEIEGSKVTPIISWIQMGCDLGLIWLKYRIGVWKIKSDKID